MRTATLLAAILALAVGALVLGGYLIWRQDSVPPDPASAAPPAETAPVSSPIVSSPARSDQPVAGPSVAANPSAGAEISPPPPAADAPANSQPENGANVDWSARVEQLLNSDLEDLQVSRQLLGLLNQAPPSEKSRIAEVLVSLMPDEGYAGVIPLVASPSTQEDVMDVLMVDLLDRPNTTQLPLLLNIAQNSSHPRREEALDYLQLHLLEDYGQDWAAWQKAVQEYLKENPE